MYMYVINVHFPLVSQTLQRTSNMMNFITGTFRDCVLKNHHPGLVLYQISSAGTSLAQVKSSPTHSKTVGQLKTTCLIFHSQKLIKSNHEKYFLFLVVKFCKTISPFYIQKTV